MGKCFEEIVRGDSTIRVKIEKKRPVYDGPQSNLHEGFELDLRL